MRKVVSLFLVFVLLLFCSGCTEEDPNDIKVTGLNMIPQVIMWGNAEEYIKSSDYVFEGIVVDISPEVINRTTGIPQRFPVSADDRENYQLMTVYTVLVTQPYKGNVGLIEQVVSDDGNWRPMLIERKKALERVGLYDPDVGVPGSRLDRNLEENKTYLFCVDDFKGGYKRENNYFVGLETDWAVAARIKDQLTPLMPPLLTFGIIVIVLAGVVTFFVICARKKKKEETEIPQDE